VTLQTIRLVSGLAVALLVAVATAGCQPSVKTVSVEPAEVNLSEAGATLQLKLIAKDDQGQVMAGLAATWGSSDPKVATVVDGKVTAIKSGQATITARVGLINGTTKVTVAVATQVQVVPSKVELVGIGSRALVAARVIDDTGGNVAKAEVTWASSDEKIFKALPAEGGATADVKAAGFGKGTLTVTRGKLSGTAEVEVKMPVIEAVEIAPAEGATVKVGATTKLAATLSARGGQSVAGISVTWASSDEKVATVDAEGTVTGVKKGKADITATSGDKNAKVAVKVDK
jgi:uncharacterized protein YjdB